MICSDNSRCKKFDLIEVNGIFICKNYNTIFNKPFKILLTVVKKDSLIENQIFHFAKIVKNLFMYNIYVKNH